MIAQALSQQNTDSSDVDFREDAEVHIFAFGLASFLEFVGVVIGDRACEQMQGIATWRIVAFVQHVNASLQRSVRLFVGDSMRSYLLPVVVSDDAVTSAIARALPFPTLVRRSWFEKVHESLRQRSLSRSITASLRTERAAFSAHWSQAALLAQHGTKTGSANAATALVVGDVWRIRVPIATVFMLLHDSILSRMEYVK